MNLHFNIGAMYGLVSALILLTLSVYIYLAKGRQRYLLLWCASWVFYGVHLFLDTVYPMHESAVFMVVRQLSQITSAVLLLWSIEAYLELKTSKYRHGALTLLGFGLVIGVSIGGPGDTSALGFSFAGAINLVTAYLLSIQGEKRIGERLMLLSLTGMGFQTLAHPWFGDTTVSGSFLYGLLPGLFILSMVVIIFDEMQLNIKGYLKHTVLSLGAAVEAKDVYTINHSQHVASLSRAIAEKMSVKNQEIEVIHFAGLLHDIGKIGIPDYILQKPGKLSPTEFEEIKLHPEIGYRILHTAGDIFKPIAPLVRHHHERWDGKGYPSGLVGESIPLGAAILAVADAFDAMVSNRSYREAMTEEMVMGEIQAGSGKQFHPLVAKVFVDNFKEITEKIYRETLVGGDIPLANYDTVSSKEKNLKFQRILRPFDYRIRYKGVLEAVNDIVLVLSEDLHIIDWNGKAEKTYGYPAEELEGMPVKNLRSPATAELLEQQLRKAEQEGGAVYETQHRKKDGNVFPVEVSLRTFTQAGQTCWFVIIRDISARKQLELETGPMGHQRILLYEKG